MSYSLQPILPPSTTFYEATGNFAQNDVSLTTNNNSQRPNKSEDAVLRAAGSQKPIAAGVRAGAHVRDLDSHGVLPIGTENIWESRDARLQREQKDKLKRFEKDSEEDYLNWVKSKERTRAEDKQEKNRVRSMLEGYNPWGKPGGGAPSNDDHRINKFTEEDLELDKTQTQNVDAEFPFYKTGGGAALKTKSGRVKAGFHEAQDIRFKEGTAKDIENKVRYEPENLSSKNLGRIPETDEITTASGISIVEEMLKNYPYATANDNKKTGMLTRNKKPTLDGDAEVYDPWGKGFGAPNRDGNGNVRRHKFSDPRKGGINAMSGRGASGVAASQAAPIAPKEAPSADWVGATIPLSERGGAGAPRNTKSGNVSTRFPQTLILTKQGDREQRMEGAAAGGLSSSLPPPLMRETSDAYDPWGRPGAGAPRRNGQGQLVHRKMRVPTGDQRLRLETKKSFLKEQEKLIDEQRTNRQRENQDLKAGYDDLASKINSGFVGRPKRDEFGQLAGQHLGVSDVTAQSTSYTRPTANPQTSKSYLTDLEKQATERRAIRDEEHQRANNDYRKHNQTFDQMWGRPGHGAPLRGNQGSVPGDGVYKKKNLIGSLYSNNFVQTLTTNSTPI